MNGCLCRKTNAQEMRSKPFSLKTNSCFDYIILCQVGKTKQFDEKFLDIDIHTYVIKFLFFTYNIFTSNRFKVLIGLISMQTHSLTYLLTYYSFRVC